MTKQSGIFLDRHPVSY